MGRRTTRRSRWERGATMVEYAILLTAIVGFCAVAVNRAQTDATTALDRRGNGIGMPDLNVSAATIPPTTIPSGGSGTTTSTVASATQVSASILSSGNPSHGNTWSPQFVVQVTNASTGGALARAIVSVRWTLQPANTSQLANCTTDASGRCTFQLSDLEGRSNKDGYVSSVTYLVVSIVGDTYSTNYAPASPLTGTINR